MSEHIGPLEGLIPPVLGGVLELCSFSKSLGQSQEGSLIYAGTDPLKVCGSEEVAVGSQQVEELTGTHSGDSQGFEPVLRNG